MIFKRIQFLIFPTRPVTRHVRHISYIRGQLRAHRYRMSGSRNLYGAVLEWDGNERTLVENVPVVIGSDPKSTIPVRNDEMVCPTHVTVTLRPDYVSVLTDLGVSISVIQYKGITGEIIGEIRTVEDFQFSLYPDNSDPNTARFINFRVVITDSDTESD